jgi:integrase
MASISHDKKTGRRIIQFKARDGKRKSIRLGKVNKRQAETAKLFLEDLVACSVSGGSPKGTTAEWIADLPDSIRRRVERVGLISPRERVECPTLAGWVRTYIEGRQDVKQGTRINLEQVERNLVEFFGGKRLDAVTAGDADDFRIYLKTSGLSEGTIRRRCKRARQFFAAAIKKKILAENPFADVQCGHYANTTRYYFVKQAEAQAVLDACPDAEWRLIFALCRFGGLRCPSEVLRLKWADIDWERDRFTVHATKTEHHADGGIRKVPIFPELAPYLTECFEAAEPGSEYLVNRYRNANVNLRTQLNRIIKRAGLTPWAKLFQNLRSTRETELVQEFPIHVVCRWIGNSTQIANKHYLQVTEEHFAEASRKAVQNPVQNPVQYPSASDCRDVQQEQVEHSEPSVCRVVQKNATSCNSKRLHSLTPRRLELRLLA